MTPPLILFYIENFHPFLSFCFLVSNCPQCGFVDSSLAQFLSSQLGLKRRFSEIPTDLWWVCRRPQRGCQEHSIHHAHRRAIRNCFLGHGHKVPLWVRSAARLRVCPTALEGREVTTAAVCVGTHLQSKRNPVERETRWREQCLTPHWPSCPRTSRSEKVWRRLV